MCGIAGVINYVSNPCPSAVENMLESMRYRGPDNSQVISESEVVFGHNRLSIIDNHESANQPMFDLECRFLITFNGEIYNYLELRQELEKLGVRFGTNSDTEVVLEAFKAWGAESYKKLNGMFAFGIWDNLKKELVIARDRFGKKPIFFFSNAKELIFASEISALVKHHSVPEKINHSAILDFLSLNYVTSSNGIYKDIMSLPPGSHLKLTRDGLGKINEFWTYEYYFQSKVNEPLDDIEEQLDELLDDAILIRHRADTNVCHFLSSGIDSTLIVARAKRLGCNFETFTASFGDKDFDEAHEAKKFCNLNDIGNTSLNGDCSPTEIRQIIDSMDMPIADTSFFPLFKLTQFAAQRNKVALTGDGGDEIFAGYPTYKATQLAKFLSVIPKYNWEQAHSFCDKMLPAAYSKLSLREKLTRFVYGNSVQGVPPHGLWRTIFRADEIRLLTPALVATTCWHKNPYRTLQQIFENENELENLDKALVYDAASWLVDNILVKCDRASMLNSIEIRSPFLDFRLAEFMATVPSKHKFNLLSNKKLLTRALKRSGCNLPDRKKKQGFNAPLHRWLDQDLLDELRDLTRSNQNIYGLCPVFIERLVSYHISGAKNNALKIFGLFVLMRWLSTRTT